MRLPISFIAGLIGITVFAAEAGAQTGTITGQVPLPNRPRGRIPVEKYTGKISGKVSPPPAPCAGVWLEGPGCAPSGPTRVELTQRGYQFAQSMLVVPVGSTVAFPNDDPDYHNIFSLSRTKRFDVGRYKKSERPAPTVTFSKAGLVRLNCEIHDHMKAYVLVVNSRWHAATDTKGRFKLSGIPAGNYTLHAQFDEKASWSTPVTVRAGQTVTADFHP